MCKHVQNVCAHVYVCEQSIENGCKFKGVTVNACGQIHIHVYRRLSSVLQDHLQVPRQV